MDTNKREERKRMGHYSDGKILQEDSEYPSMW